MFIPLTVLHLRMHEAVITADCAAISGSGFQLKRLYLRS